MKVGEGSALGRAFELTAGVGPERPAWGADRVGEEEALQARLLARLEAESGGSGTAEEGEGVYRGWVCCEITRGGGDGTGWQVNKCYRSRRSELVRWGALVLLGERLRRGGQVVLAANKPEGQPHAEQLAAWLAAWVGSYLPLYFYERKAYLRNS